MVDYCAFGFGDPPREEGGVGGFERFRATLLGRRVVSAEDHCAFDPGDAPGEEDGVGGRLLTSLLGRRVVLMENYYRASWIGALVWVDGWWETAGKHRRTMCEHDDRKATTQPP